MLDRRTEPRRPLDVYFNKYIEGYPHLCRSRDLSRTGLRATAFSEPDSAADGCALELQLPGDEQPLWVWARAVWRRDQEQALEFVSINSRDRARLEAYLRAHSLPDCVRSS
jgi:hypothetical protein